MTTVAQSVPIFIGCAGWNIPRTSAANFPTAGSHLERYSSRFNTTEINTSFYRPHRTSTYTRWAASVRDEFKFSVKMPKQITHSLRLSNALEPTNQFLQEVRGLGDKLGCILVQLPPSLQFSPNVANSFFKALRDQHEGSIACEPRHVSWFSPDANETLRSHAVARVAADPAIHPDAEQPGGFSALHYFRLHGSPRTYYSPYTEEFLNALAAQLVTAVCETHEVWCIFDNTAEGHAAENALRLQVLIDDLRQRAPTPLER